VATGVAPGLENTSETAWALSHSISITKTNSTNLKRKFDQSEDVMDYFDLAKASRPLLQKERINLDIPHWMILKIDRVARRKGLPRQAQIKEWLSQKLKEEEPSAS
jgi:hypothetical protein